MAHNGVMKNTQGKSAPKNRNETAICEENGNENKKNQCDIMFVASLSFSCSLIAFAFSIKFPFLLYVITAGIFN